MGACVRAGVLAHFGCGRRIFEMTTLLAHTRRFLKCFFTLVIVQVASMLLLAYCTDLSLEPVRIVYYPFVVLLSPFFRASDGLLGVALLTALAVGSAAYSMVAASLCTFALRRKANSS